MTRNEQCAGYRWHSPWFHQIGWTMEPRTDSAKVVKKCDMRFLQKFTSCHGKIEEVYHYFTSVRIELYVNKTTHKYQAGFWNGISTIGQLFTIKQVLEICRQFNIALCSIFVNSSQAYDSIERNALYKAMLDLGVPPKLVSPIRMSVPHITAHWKSIIDS